MNEITRAISIRQPYVELILQGKKWQEFRSRRTHLRGRVYLYASMTPKDDPLAFRGISRALESILPCSLNPELSGGCRQQRSFCIHLVRGQGRGGAK